MARNELRDSLEDERITVLPGAYDAVTAKLAERNGFPALFATGYGIAASLGYPDIGLMTMSENLGRVDYITDAVDIPVIADIDTGYGDALNVRRTVGKALDVGVQGIMLEDQTWPKRCAHMEGKSVVARDTHVQRIRAATDVRAERDEDLVIIARTDARQPEGLEEAIDRGRAYFEAGADVIFVVAPESVSELERITEALDAPLFADMFEGGKTPLLPFSELQAMGYDMVVYGVSALLKSAYEVDALFAELREEEVTTGVEMLSSGEFNDLLDLEEYKTLGDRYV